MVTVSRSCKILIIAAALFSANTAVAAEPWVFSGRYVFGWGAISFGYIDLNVNQDGKKADITTSIKTTGILKFFAPHTSQTVLSAVADAPSRNARLYETHYTTKKKPRHVKLTYGDKGVLTEEIVEPPENPEKRPPVPAELKNGVADPLSFILDIHSALRAARASGDDRFTLRVYDGRRLTDVAFNIYGVEPLKRHGNMQDMLKVGVTRRAVGGFTDKELKELKDDRELFIYFTNDDALMPVLLHVDVAIGSLEAELQL